MIRSAAGLVPGALLGAQIAFALPAKTLKLVVATVLVLAALFLGGKLVVAEAGWLSPQDNPAANASASDHGIGFA